MEIRLAAEQEALARELLGAGHFDSPAEAVQVALGLLKDQYELYKIKHAGLKKLIAVGIEQAGRGDLIDGEEVFRRLREKIEDRAGRTGQVAPLDMEAIKARAERRLREEKEHEADVCPR